MAIDLIDQILPHIKNAAYPKQFPLSDWKVKDGSPAGAFLPKFNDKSWMTLHVPFEWGKSDRTFWFRAQFEVPEELSGKSIALVANAPNGLLYVNGVAFQAIDETHSEALLTTKARAGQHYSFAIQAYSGKGKEHHSFKNSFVSVLNPTARALHSGLTALKQLAELVEHNSQEAKDIRELIRRTLIFLKYFKPEGEEYPNAIERANTFLQTAITEEFRTTITGMIHLIPISFASLPTGNSEQDRVASVLRPISTNIRLLEEFPTLNIVQGEAGLYNLLETSYPELFKLVKQLVLQNRWESLDSRWSNADLNIPAGESLVRNLLLGNRYFGNVLGKSSTTGWFPTASGLPATLPQILKKSGLTSVFSASMLGNDTTLFPYSTYWWEGIDGSKIFAHQPAVGPEGQGTPEDILRSSAAFDDDAELLPPAIQMIGNAQLRVPPTKQELEAVKVMRGVTGIPPTRLSTPREFFTERAEFSSKFPVWKGEQYHERRRGRFSFGARLKQLMRSAEVSLYQAEVLAVLTSHQTSSWGKYPAVSLADGWKSLAEVQSDEILTGPLDPSSTEHATAQLGRIHEQSHRSVQASQQAMSKKPVKGVASFSVMNTLGWQRSSYVEVTLPLKAKHLTVLTEDGTPAEIQVLEQSKNSVRFLLYAEELPAFGSKNFIATPSESAANHETWKHAEHSFETPIYRARIDNKGAFSSLYDKQLRRDLVQKGKRINLLQAFKNSSSEADVLELRPDFERHRLELFELKSSVFVENGPLRYTVKMSFKTEHGSSLSQLVHFYHKSPRIDFDNRFSIKEKGMLLKFAAALNVKTNSVSYEIPFGSIERPMKTKDEREKAKFEVPAQQWADLSESKFGISLLNNGRYGHDCRDGLLRITAVNAPTIEGSTSATTKMIEASEMGEHHFSYAIFPHAGDRKKGQAVQQAREFNVPVLTAPFPIKSPAEPFVELSKSNVLIDSLKKAEDSESYILRVHEAYGEAAEVTFRFGFVPKEIAECDLMEMDIAPLKAKKEKLSLRFKAFEIKTLRISMKPLKK